MGGPLPRGTFPPEGDDPLFVAGGADPPVGATVLSVLGGILVVLAGSVLLSAGSAVGGGLRGLLGTFGWAGILSGLLLMVLGFAVWAKPEWHVEFGAGILVFSFLGWFGGGGFLLGSVLAFIGGILAIIYEPD